MAESALISIGLDKAFDALLHVAQDAAAKLLWCDKHCQDLAEDLDKFQPAIKQICSALQSCLRDEDLRCLSGFEKDLEEGRSLIEDFLRGRVGWRHPFRRYRYSRKIVKLRQKILTRLLELNVLNIRLSTDHGLQLKLLNDHGLQLKLLNERVLQVDARVKDEAKAILDEFHVRDSAAEAAAATSMEVIDVDQEYLVGLNERIDEVKSLLLRSREDEEMLRSLEDETMVMIVGGAGGIGKTTLAASVCRDLQVQEFFEQRIYFFTVSQSPDMKALLSAMWEKMIVNTRVPIFQNTEDAHRQLKGELCKMDPKRRLLVVLDDVWKRDHLENLLFKVEGLKMMITTRQAFAMESHCSHTIKMEVLSEANARRLFCYHAFRQDSIPPWVEDPEVVQKVIAKCGGLPLALKVIGASLYSHQVWDSLQWQRASKKLGEAEALGDYHKEAVYSRLQTSIDVLDPPLRECFLDLPAFPEASRFSAETLLNIWVYVRGLEWDDAVYALMELASRHLVDLHSSSALLHDAVKFKTAAAALLISQHDVMRGLALHLGGKSVTACQRKRLLMPREGRNVPRDWQQQEALLAAQVISISTGIMAEEDWPRTLAFPLAEALVLHISDSADFERDSNYALPPFIQSMPKLKVLATIRSSRFQRRPLIIEGCLGGSSELRSIQMQGVSPRSPTSAFLGDFSNLEKLQLLCGGGADDVAPVLSKKLGKLMVGHLEECKSLKHLSPTIGQLAALEELNLRGCEQLQELPSEGFGELSKLRRLRLRDCKSLKHLPPTLGQLAALEELDLGGCEQLQELPPDGASFIVLYG